eukprot:590869-Lingulodinium_polyedra.AAC.1
MDEENADEPVYEWTRCRHLLHRTCFEAMRRSEIELQCPICRLDAHGVASVLCCVHGFDLWCRQCGH